MAKYRPVDIRVWSDRKVASLSPNAKLLWLFLLTAPSSLPIPGVVIGGSAALAEQLGITAQLFDQLFDELLRKQISVRREGRIIWLPNALNYQVARNPNTVKAWGRSWDDIPDVALKAEIWQALKISCKSWSVLFKQLFREPTEICSANNPTQEQYQDQKQDQDQDLEEGEAKSPRARKTPSGDHQLAIEAFDSRYRERYGQSSDWGGKQCAIIAGLLKKHGRPELERRIEILFTAPPGFLEASPPDVETLKQHWNKLVAPTIRAGPRGSQSPSQSTLNGLLAEIRDLESQERS